MILTWGETGLVIQSRLVEKVRETEKRDMSRSLMGLILLSVAISSLAQITLKAGMAAPDVQRTLTLGLRPALLINVLFTPYILLGLFFYFASAIVWLLVLARIPVSTAYPFVALGFIFTAVLGWLVFNDSFSPAKLLATFLIAGGVGVMALG